MYLYVNICIFVYFLKDLDVYESINFIFVLVFFSFYIYIIYEYLDKVSVVL